MTAPEVDAVLSAIADNWPGPEGDLSDVPLQRIDRDNADNIDDAENFANLDGPLHRHGESLQEMAYVGARSTTRTDTPVGTEYDVQTDTVVGVRLEAAHVGEFGAIDPQKGTAQERSVGWPTRTWNSLTDDVVAAIYTDRLDPGGGSATISYKDLFIENRSDQSADYADYYRLDFDVRFSGFETLP